METPTANPARDLFRTELVERRERLARVVIESPRDTRLAGLLSEVDSALERIENGTYGLCETCHDTIERDRLLADPLVRFCLDHLTPVEQRALEQDLQLAAEIQRGLLPPAVLNAKGWEVAYHFAPLGAVSGDYCDVVLPDAGSGDVFFLLGDVSGKGVAASILMGNLHATFRTLLAGGLPIDALMQRANRLFCESTIASQYATLACVKASPGGQIEVANAGHCPVLVRTARRTHSLKAGGLPLGMFCSSVYLTERVRVEVGDTLLLYTDGVIEARSTADEEYGEAGLVSMFDRLCTDSSLGPRGIADACLADVEHFMAGSTRTDDVTIMAVRRSA